MGPKLFTLLYISEKCNDLNSSASCPKETEHEHGIDYAESTPNKANEKEQVVTKGNIVKKGEKKELLFKNDEEFKRIMFPEKTGNDYSAFDDTETFIISDNQETVIQS